MDPSDQRWFWLTRPLGRQFRRNDEWRNCRPSARVRQNHRWTRVSIIIFYFLHADWELTSRENADESCQFPLQN